eukprot:7552354-Lingulodinium_polyedra.AAC.1
MPNSALALVAGFSTGSSSNSSSSNNRANLAHGSDSLFVASPLLTVALWALQFCRRVNPLVAPSLLRLLAQPWPPKRQARRSPALPSRVRQAAPSQPQGSRRLPMTSSRS